MKNEAESPISFPVSVRRLPEKGFPVVIEANERQRAALAEVHGLLAVELLRAEVLVKTWKRDGIRVTGRVEAKVVQQCVVTLEPIDARVAEDIDSIFVPEQSPLARVETTDGEIFLSADGPEAPETFDGETIDAGALAEEFFALGLDPYPRKADAAVAVDDVGDDEASPFAVLRDRLRNN